MAYSYDDNGNRTLQLPTDEVLTRVSDAVFALNREWEFTYVNPKAEKLLHRDAEELLGTNVWEQFPDAVGSTFESEYKHAMETQSFVSFVEYYSPMGTWFKVQAYPSETGLSIFFTSVTEKLRRAQDLEKYEQIVETVDDGIFTIDVTGTILEVNEAYTALTGYSREELVGEIPSFLVDDETIREFVQIQEALLWGDRETATMASPLKTADGDRVATETTLTPFTADGETRVTGVVRDISDRERYQRRLKSLHEATRELMAAKTKTEIGKIVVETTEEIVDLPALAVYFWDDADGRLVPRSYSQDIYDLFDELPAFKGGRSLAWDAFVENEVRVYDDVREEDECFNPDTVVKSELFAPLGDHGILISGSTESGFYDSAHVDLVSILAANATVALDRAERQARLAERQDELQRRNERLTNLTRINHVVRDIQHALVNSSTRQEAEEAICENLATVDPHCFAWIGKVGHYGRIEPQTWYGENGAFLDHLQGSDDVETEPRSPATQTAETGEPVVVNRILHDESFPEWRKQALKQGFQSAISLPLVGTGTIHGVVEIYASESNAFGDEATGILFKLSEIIADGFEVIERRQTIASANDTEVELRANAGDSPLARIARKHDVELELDSATLRDDGTWLLYVTAAGCDSEAVCSTLDDSAVVETVRRIPTDSEGELFGVTVTEFEIGRILTEYGATLKGLSVTDEEIVLELRTAPEVDVRTLLDDYRTLLPDVELARRENSVRQSQTAPLQSSFDTLTERQREVLQVAYDEGYFEWPREATGEEIAEMLGISNPVFHRHVRRALQKQLTSQFEG